MDFRYALPFPLTEGMESAMRIIRRVWDTSERGQELVEFALILPLLLLLLFGIIEFGIVVYRYNLIAHMGREVARYGSINPDTVSPDPDPINAHIQSVIYPQWATAMPTDTLTITATVTPGHFISSTVNVTVTYRHQFLTGPIIAAVGGDGRMTMRTVSTMHLERPLAP
jgi:Flp pilus assembly protein TadG